MKLTRILTIILVAISLAGGIYAARPQTIQPHPKEVHLRNIRQLTSGSENAEAYFSLDGQKIIFQSTRDSPLVVVWTDAVSVWSFPVPVAFDVP